MRYPSFQMTESSFEASIEGDNKIKLDTKADWNAADGKVTISVAVTNEESRKAFLTAVCNSAVILLIYTKDTSKNTPLVSSTSVTIAQRTVGCPPKDS